MLIYIDDKFSAEFSRLNFENKIIENFLFEMSQKSKGYQLVTLLSQKEYASQMFSDPIIQLISENSKSITYSISTEILLSKSSSIHKLLLVGNECFSKLDDLSVECFCANNIQDKWVSYSTLRDDYSLPTTDNKELESEEKFFDWSNLKRWKHPVTDVFIYDKYLLVDRSQQSIKKNLEPFLYHLSFLGSDILNVRIFTLKSSLCLDLKSGSIENRIRLIKAQLKHRMPNAKITLSLYENGDKFFWLQHDRSLLTNYYLIERGAGFNIFDNTGRMRDNSNLTFKFIFHKGNYSSYTLCKKNMNTLIKEADSDSNLFENFIL
jgi:hypothetical protein